MSVAAGLSVLALMFSLSVQGALYSDAGSVPQGGMSLSFEHVVTGDPCAIDGVELVLTFSSSCHLDLDGSSIKGALILDPGGTGATTTYEAFSASVSPSGTSGQQIYDLTFPAGGNFKGCNPNGTWALNLWDTGADGIENSLVSWSVNASGVTSVPEPANVALAIFTGAVLLATLARSRPVAFWKNSWRTGGAP
jgi:hypothetical protein